MDDFLKKRLTRLLESLDDEKGYQALDYLEFLTSKYAERGQPDGLFAKITSTVENTMRAGKLPIQAISGTMNLMDSAAKVMRGLAAAGQAVVEEALREEPSESKPPTETKSLPDSTRPSPGAPWPRQRE
jgi:hypothetical protein